MFEFFKGRKWIPDAVAELHGSCQALKVTIRNLPCLRDAATGMRKYAYRDFGNEFLNGLHEQLGDFELLSAKLNAGATAHTLVRLSSFCPITVEIRGTPSNSRRQFDSDIAEAIIEAFKSANLRP